MIRNEAEYREAVERLSDEKVRFAGHRARLAEQGLNSDQIKAVMDPLLSFHLQLVEELTSYERLCRRDFDELINFKGLGRTLVALRVAYGITQRALAERLGVHESQVSRDERNEYFGITVERAARVVEALGVKLKTTVDVDTPQPTREMEAA